MCAKAKKPVDDEQQLDVFYTLELQVDLEDLVIAGQKIDIFLM